MCTSPTTNLTTCASCANNCDGNQWCPSTSKCYYTPNGEGVTCPATTNAGVLTGDCDCADAFSVGEDTCDSCTSLTWCPYEGLCQAITHAEPKPCSSPTCPGGCLCLPGSDKCVACKPGLTSTSSGCNRRCAPNCLDCQPSAATQCLTQCAVGWTNFPACDKPCPSECITCGGSMVNDTLAPSACRLCADRGATAPNCTTCFDGVCKGSAGTCDQPCGSSFAHSLHTKHSHNSTAKRLQLADYPHCADCQALAKKLAALGRVSCNCRLRHRPCLHMLLLHHSEAGRHRLSQAARRGSVGTASLPTKGLCVPCRGRCRCLHPVRIVTVCTSN